MPEWTQEQITMSLMAVVAWAGNLTAASKDLRKRGLVVQTSTLSSWVKDTHREEYERMREKYADEKERQMAHEFRDVAAQSVQVMRLALDNAERRLLSGEDKDPSKTAMNASRVAHTSVDKLMSLTNRPQKITEQRDVGEVIRSLAGMGVLVPLPAGAKELEGAADDPDAD